MRIRRGDKHKLIDENGRPQMLEAPAKVYAYDGSKYPDQLKVSFGDGKVMVYDLHVEQPHPLFQNCLDIIHKWKVGYQFNEAEVKANG